MEVVLTIPLYGIVLYFYYHFMSTGETLQEEPQGTSEEPVPPEDMLPLSSVGSTMSQ